MEKKQKQTENWKGLIQGFTSKVLEQIGDNLSLRLHKWITQLKRRAVGSLLLAVGITFLLNGIALYINMLTQDLFPWLGYSAVGIITMFIGYVMLKE